MPKTAIIVCICLLCICFLSNIASKSSGPANPISTAQISNPVASEIELTSTAYPSQLYFGDTFYVQTFQKNISPKSIEFHSGGDITQLGFFEERFLYEITSKEVKGCYEFVPEWYPMRDAGKVASIKTLNPGETLKSVHPLELPPLHVMTHPFWQEVLQKMTDKGVKCKLTLRFGPPRSLDVDKSWISQRKNFSLICSHDLLIKAREKDEQKLLNQWLAETPKEMLPPVLTKRLDDKWWREKWHGEFMKKGYRQSGDHYIEINTQKYNPWMFIREGYRKPPACVCPINSMGWKLLEESLTPSTMRDEIRLTRMLIEYYELNGLEQDEKRREIIKWLQSLPKPQNMSMASSIASLRDMYFIRNNRGYYLNDLGLAYKKLVHDLSSMASDIHQWHENHYMEHHFPKIEE